SCHVLGAVVWSDEFDGPNIDKNTWTWDAGGHGFGNGQFEYNTALSQNSYIDNGSLVIKAIRENYMGNEFTSARMMTQGRFAFKYGTLEARIKLPDTENGLWPAFWLLGNNFPAITWPESGEVDIVEMGSAAGITEGLQQEKINCAIHYDLVNDGLYDDATKAFNASWTDAAVDLSLDYHLYKVEWTPTDMTFYLDGVQFGTWNIEAEHFSEFHQPQFPILNIAIGGYDPSYTGVYSPAGVTALPTAGSTAEMRVDWIRLEDNAFTEVYLGADTAEFGNFGVFTENTPVDNALVYAIDDTDPAFEYSDEAALYTWNNMTDAATHATASEGSECWTFDVGAGEWFGMGVFLPNFRNMMNYSDGFLHFDVQSTLTDTMKVGVKSSRGGEFWLPIGDETAEFGFARDGAWHSITVPLNRFANTDFNTIHQIFMFVGDTASASTTISFDNIYWEPSVARPTPANGSFGVFTEDATHKDAGEFALGVDGDFFVWENTLNATAETAYEGSESMTFTGAGAGWFGMAFTPNVKHNLTAFSYPESKLRFAMKTTATSTFQVGMKSGNVDGVGQKWITFANGSDPYGFVRDGAWHVVEIPMEDIIADVDLFEVSQLFQILGFVDISNIEIDDVCFIGGGEPLTPESGDTNIPPSVSITSPANGTFYDAGDDIVITADATDGDGTGVVTKVEFFEGLTLLGEDLTSPYSIAFNDVAEGAYTFRAKATDPNDASRTSSAVTVYVGTPVLTSISVSPAAATVQTGQLQQFNVSGS
ncbi:MAG: family 16 glycosylhydrolase, partial [Planctomycetota bacterium]